MKKSNFCCSIILAALIMICFAFISGCSTNQETQNEQNGISGGQIQSPSEDSCVCTMDYAPVCGADGITYGNKCAAECKKVSWIAGECTAKN